jgi:hypothetical protein
MKKMPKLLKIIRDDAFIKFSHEVSRTTEVDAFNDPDKPSKAGDEPKKIKHTSSEEHIVTAYDAPLPTFDKALQALASVVANVFEAGQEWKKGINIRGLSVSYTKTGLRSVVIDFNKKFDITEEFHPMKTPSFRIDDGKTAADGRRECSPNQAETIIKMIKEAEKYASGERSQQMLNLTEDEDGEEDDGAGEKGKKGDKTEFLKFEDEGKKVASRKGASD